MRLGANVGSHVQLGVAADWIYKTKSLTLDNDSLPNFQTKIELARVTANMFPLMGFLQVKLTDRFPIVPYLGAAAGYAWLVLQANDYRTFASTSRTYDNPTWQTYAGLGLALGKDARLDGELFFQGATLQRQIVDSAGQTWNELVDVSGVGARIEWTSSTGPLAAGAANSCQPFDWATASRSSIHSIRRASLSRRTIRWAMR
jgi:hypothetical protein